MWIKTIQLKMKYEMALQEKEQDQDKTTHPKALHTEFFTLGFAHRILHSCLSLHGFTIYDALLCFFVFSISICKTPTILYYIMSHIVSPASTRASASAAVSHFTNDW